jgi:digeranylgeranylglycerophospholipid reductase
MSESEMPDSTRQQFDGVVVGGGPAGGQCARQLAQAGYRVLLIERYKDFSRNSFSSGGTPLETLEQFALPESVLGSFWDRLTIVTSNKEKTWQSQTVQGGVFDFAKLRDFLADQVKAHGGEVWMGCRYVQHCPQDDGLRVTIKDNLKQCTVEVNTRVLVDATGPARAITCAKGKPQPELVSGTGVEYLVRVDPETYARNANRLTFLLGHKWIPRGYSWIFPMDDQTLKVGAGSLNLAHRHVQRLEPLQHYIDLLISDYLQPQQIETLDIHGETLRYSLGLRDTYVEGRVIAIGDAVSTVNLLGGEGIRHAMVSAEVAAKHISAFLQEERLGFDHYQSEMHRIFLNKWKVSEKLGLKKYIQDSDALVDKVVTYLAPLSLEQVVDLLFYYRFERALTGSWRNLAAIAFRKLRRFLGLGQP